MKALTALLCLLFLTSCLDDDASVTFTPNEALEGQWQVDKGFYLWDNGKRISSMNPLMDSIPSVQLQFSEDNRFKIQYAFFVTNGFDQDTVTITNGIQEGTYELMATEDNILDYSGRILFEENITNIMDEADIRYQLGNNVDSLWLQGVRLNNLLFGEISGSFFKNSR